MLFNYFSSNIILRIEMLTTRFSLWKKLVPAGVLFCDQQDKTPTKISCHMVS